ncbi:hypothetical protein CPB83DRAFT_909491 [Crepidotus variabilis]|uniref:Uncharacterized protein n=1 Tax=Crepidotus variabilis TaxID=179855 RepID=A0A9P6JLS2_9AGAR|nr:hypothetical protein CPB83DRAFT_909491 [Crepidotus variabilis]
MAKKNKGFKVKQYKEPQEKFLVVVNPWGIFNNFDQADFNHIGAWFEFMLQEKHPGSRLRAIYYQRTHKNIIVELPSEVKDVEPFLGAHHYQSFLVNAPLSTEVAIVYEYRYSTFGDPSDKNFVMGYPMYNNLESIPSTFPVKREYPPSFSAPAPPLDVPYARPIPPEVNERKDARQRMALELAVRAAEPSVASPSTVLAVVSSPHELHGPSRPSKKTVDPRKRPLPTQMPLPQPLGQLSSEVEKGKQRATSPIAENKKIEEEHQAESKPKSLSAVKQDEAENFLDDLFPIIKSDEDVKPDLDEYKMSDALRNAIQMLELPDTQEDIDTKPVVKPEPIEVSISVDTPLMIKPEPVETSLSGTDFDTGPLIEFLTKALRFIDDSEYVPSDALVAAWNALSNGVFEGQGGRHTVKSEPEPEDSFVKQEPSESFNLHIGCSQQSIKREREINAEESGYEPLKRVKIEHQWKDLSESNDRFYRKFSVTEVPSQTQWRRLKSFYASRIRNIVYLPYAFHREVFDLRILRKLCTKCETPSSSPLFPNLLYLEFTRMEDAYPCLDIFLKTNGISVSLQWATSASSHTEMSKHIFPAIATCAPNIFELDLGSVQLAGASESEPLSKVVCGMTQLRGFASGPRKLLPEALRHLALLPDLLKLCLVNNSEDVLKAVGSESRAIFPALQYFTIRDGGDMSAFTSLINRMRPQLYTLAIYFDNLPGPRNVHTALVVLSSRSDGRHSLHEVLLKLTLVDVRTVQGANPQDSNLKESADAHIIEPLRSFPNIVKLDIDIPWNFNLGDTDIEVIAQAWSKLRVLKIGSMLGWGKLSLITPDGLLALLKGCRELEQLSLQFNGGCLPPSIDSIPKDLVNLNIDYLFVGESPVFSTMDIPKFLHRIFPRLNGIGGCWLATHIPDNHPGLAEAWEQVVKGIQDLKAIKG